MRNFSPRSKPYILTAAVLFAAACAETDPPTAVTSVDPGPANFLTYEEEIFGNLYSNGALITSGNYYVQLQEVDAEGDPIGPESFIWVNPDKYDSGWMYGWYDVAASDGPCNPQSMNRMEVHTLYPDPLDQEIHCIEAGSRYRFTLFDNFPDFGDTLKTFIIDYPKYLNAVVTNYTHSPSRYDMIQIRPSSTTWYYNDAYISVDLQPYTGGSDTPVLWIDNAGTSIDSGDDFTDQTSPTAVRNEYLQFSASGSSFTSNISHLYAKEPLAKLWIYSGTARTNLVHETGWYTSRMMAFSPNWRGLERTIRFSDLGLYAGTYEVALELMRADEAVPSTPTSNAAWRTITITNEPLSVGISGTSTMQPYMTCPLYGWVNGGQPPYTWTWSVSGKGGSVVPGQDGNADVTIRYQPITVTAIVQDGAGAADTASFAIASSPSGPSACL